MRNIATVIYVFIMDISVLFQAREIILDFLRGACSKKHFRQIVEMQSISNKLTLSFVGNYLKNPDFLKPYSFYRYTYYIFACVVCPLKNAALLFREYFCINSELVFMINLSICFIFGIIFSIERPGKRYSRYAGRKYNRSKPHK